MAIFRSFNDLVISFIEYLRLVQPELDTKPGTVARDLFVDSPAQQLAELYSQLQNISSLQSLFSTSGRDLGRLASNFGVSRKTGTSATGVAIFTTNNLDIDILIPTASVVVANNGVNFQTTSGVLLSAANANVYRATATRLRTELDLASITDEFAVEVPVEALTTGTSGNIGLYSISTHNVSGISSVTNLQTFSGGTNAESDDQFRTRILSVFAGSNTGTALGYTTAVNAVAGIQDSIIVVPGDPLLIRDGTQVSTDSNGDLVVSDPGSGGKVDIYILGSSLDSQVDSFIYNDQSGNNDPTDPSNDVVLGQRGAESGTNVATRRVELIAANALPFQPVSSVLSVAGSASGPNFVEKYTDSAGRVRGNYELVKDSGDFGGSSFGFDRLRWVSNEIELTDEERVKGTFNGINELDFNDVEEVTAITQDFLVTNENSTTSTSNRSSVYLKHTPVDSVSRIVNLTTGERYVVENQNPDGDAGELNTTGRITISGNTLPVSTDVLQVDYLWIKSFDSVFDFDNLKDYNPSRLAQDSVDWGFGNLVINEPATVVDDGYGVLTVTVTHPIGKVVTVNSFSTDVSTVVNGTITVNTTVVDVVDIRRASDGAEVFQTDSHGGALSGTGSIVLPTDTVAENGDVVNVRFNSSDTFAPDGYDPGSFDTNVITLPQGIVGDGTQVLVNYVTSILILLPEMNLSALPATNRGNVFVVNEVTTGNQPTSNLFDDDGAIEYNLRRAPSNLRIETKGIGAGGTISVLGSSVKKVEDALVVVTSGTGFEVDLQAAILDDLGVSTLPSTVRVSKLYSMERVNLDGFDNVSSVDNVYDVVNYGILDPSFDLSLAQKDTSLNKTKVSLATTPDNVAAQLSTGDIVRVTFYYTNTAASEALYFSKDGTQVTNNVFSYVSKLYVSSGFKNAAGVMTGTVRVRNFNQPADNTSYAVDYNYVAPKENERITITFNHNSLVNTVTTSLEDVRPITADVLVKEAGVKLIDMSIRIVLSAEFATQSQIVLQDATDIVTSFLSSSSLGTTIDASDVTNVLYSVQGIDRVRIFNLSVGDSGNLASISAEKNEYLSAGTVDIQVEER